MRLSNFLYIVGGNLTERKARALSAVLIIAFTVSIVLAVAALSLGFLRGVLQKAGEVFPPSVLLVKPKTMAVAMLSFNAGVINRETVKTIAAMPGVGTASPQLSMKMPLRMEVEIAGQTAVTDCVVIGVEPHTVQDDVVDKFRFDYDKRTSEPVPAIVPRFLLDMYNLAYADSVGLPKINEQFLIGKIFSLHLGETYLMSQSGGASGKTREVECKVVGLSSNASLVAGVYIPLRHAEELNHWYTGKEANDYTAMQVTVKDLDRLDDVTSAVQAMTLMVEGNKETYESIRFATRTASYALALFAGIIVLISAVTIFNMFSLMMIQRSGEIALMRAVGGSAKTITGLYLFEVGAIAMAGAAIGSALTLTGLSFLENILVSKLPVVDFLPDQIFKHSVIALILVVLGCMTICLAAAIIPMRRLQRLHGA